MIEKGKCFSSCDQGQRRESDLYETHYSMTKQLLDIELFDRNKSIIEPACGNLAIVDVLSGNKPLWSPQPFLNLKYTDLNRGDNFLDCNDRYDYLITNPPYSLADKFVEKAKEIVNKKFAMLMRINFLQGQKRLKTGLFISDGTNCGLKNVYVFCRMSDLRCPIREDGKYTTAMLTYCWYIFERGYIGKPIIDWIDNSEYVLKKRDLDG